MALLKKFFLDFFNKDASHSAASESVQAGCFSEAGV